MSQDPDGSSLNFEMFYNRVRRLWDIRRIARPDCWAFFVAAAVVAAAAASAAYHTWELPVTYRDFVSGGLAWTDAFKGRDYAMLATFVASFLLMLPAMAHVSASLSNGTLAADRSFNGLIAVALLPACIGVSAMLLTRHTSLFLLYVSAGLIVVAVLVGATLASRSILFRQALDVGRACTSMGTSLLLLTLAAAAGAGGALAVSRLGIVWGYGRWAWSTEVAWGSVGAAAGAALGVIFYCAGRSATPRILEARLGRALVAAQIGLPALFFCLLPTPVLVDAQQTFGYPVSTAAWIVVAVLVVLAYADVVRCTRKHADVAFQHSGIRSLEFT